MQDSLVITSSVVIVVIECKANASRTAPFLVAKEIDQRVVLRLVQRGGRRHGRRMPVRGPGGHHAHKGAARRVQRPDSLVPRMAGWLSPEKK